MKILFSIGLLSDVPEASGVPRNFFQGGFNKFSWGQRTEMTGIWGL